MGNKVFYCSYNEMKITSLIRALLSQHLVMAFENVTRYELVAETVSTEHGLCRN